MGANVRSRYAWVIVGGVGASIGKVIYDAVGDGIGVDTAIHVAIIAGIATGVALAVAFRASRRDGSREQVVAGRRPWLSRPAGARRRCRRRVVTPHVGRLVAAVAPGRS